jgi:ATP-binding cassette subfamily B protein
MEPRTRDVANAAAPEAVLPELRSMWWETGMRARATNGMLAVFADLPRLVATAIAISWCADRARMTIVAAATVGAGVLSTFGLLATQRVLLELFAAGPRRRGSQRPYWR